MAAKKAEWLNSDLMSEFRGFSNRCLSRELSAVEYDITFEDMHLLLYPPDMREPMRTACEFSSLAALGGYVKFEDDQPGELVCCVRMNQHVACPSGFPCPIIPRSDLWKKGAYDDLGVATQHKIAAAYYAVKEIKQAWNEVQETLTTLKSHCNSLMEMRSLWPATVPLIDKYCESADDIRQYKPVKFQHDWTGEQIAMFKRANYTMMTAFLHPDDNIRLKSRAVTIDADHA